MAAFKILGLFLVLGVMIFEPAGASSNYHHIGCYKDKLASRALPTLLGTFHNPATAVKQCASIAWQKGYTNFGLQYGGQCWSGEKGDLTYNRYGRSRGCHGGIGGVYANDVYQFPLFVLLKRLRDKYTSLSRILGGRINSVQGQVNNLKSKDRVQDSQINSVTNRVRRAHVTCHTKYTSWNDRADKPIVFLDRHRVACPSNYFVSYFHLNRSGAKIRYTYKCCRFLL